MARALMISGVGSGVGKTTATLGLIRALRRNGLRVAAAKSGPDYIDPGFLAAASGGEAINLDAFAMADDELRGRAADHSAREDADVLIIEGAMGLFDGAAHIDERPAIGLGASARVAAAIGAPILMVLDCAGRAQSVAIDMIGASSALCAWRSNAPLLAGALLNNTGGPAHGALVREAIEAAGFAVFGELPRAENVEAPSRHLGLRLAQEHFALDRFLDTVADKLEETTDLAGLASAGAPLLPPRARYKRVDPLGQRIAVAQDDAFAFAYPHLLQDWRRQGAELLLFSPLADDAPPLAADSIFLPGGYPELHCGALSSAQSFRKGMSAAAERGALIYGECGGYMALGDALTDADGRRWPMLGLLPLTTEMTPKRTALGYRRLTPLPGAPFAAPLCGHEFHYARIAHEGNAPRLFRAARASDADLGEIGLCIGSVCGSFAHIIAPETQL